jgi:hypothetical protein
MAGHVDILPTFLICFWQFSLPSFAYQTSLEVTREMPSGIPKYRTRKEVHVAGIFIFEIGAKALPHSIN